MRSSDSVAQRKRLLTAQAALLRLEALAAREELRDSLRPVALLGAFARQGKTDVADLLQSFRGGEGNRASRFSSRLSGFFPALLPLLEIALPLLPKRRLLRALLSRRGAALAGVAAVGALIAHRLSRSPSTMAGGSRTHDPVAAQSGRSPSADPSAARSQQP